MTSQTAAAPFYAPMFREAESFAIDFHTWTRECAADEACPPPESTPGHCASVGAPQPSARGPFIELRCTAEGEGFGLLFVDTPEGLAVAWGSWPPSGDALSREVLVVPADLRSFAFEEPSGMHVGGLEGDRYCSDEASWEGHEHSLRLCFARDRGLVLYMTSWVSAAGTVFERRAERSHASPTQAPARRATPNAGITGRSLFCAYGGVGSVPDPLPPGYETTFVSMVFEIDNPGPPVAGVSVAGASLRDDAGAPLASLARLDHFVDLSGEPAPDPTWGSFAVHLNGTGTPFLGALPTGITRLRIRYAIPSSARLPTADHCRAELSTSVGPLVIAGPLDGVWPS